MRGGDTAEGEPAPAPTVTITHTPSLTPTSPVPDEAQDRAEEVLDESEKAEEFSLCMSNPLNDVDEDCKPIYDD